MEPDEPTPPSESTVAVIDAPEARSRRRLPDAGFALRLAVLVAAVLVAYHYTFQTMLDGLRLDTPLAHLGLVPFIAILVAASVRHRPAGPDIHDRQLDWIVGVPLIALSLGMNLWMPGRMGTMFWVWRIDLLSLPLFVAGAITLLFGVRTLWRFRVPVLLLFLAWPVPFTYAVQNWLNEFTNLTIAGVRAALTVVPVASAAGSGDGSLFVVAHQTSQITLSIASACSGANGLVGFLLTGLAFCLVTQGAWWRKALWLATGAALVWILNVVRIVVIFAAAKTWGERVAMDGFHPYIGLVVFTAAVLTMILVSGLFGLRLPPPPKKGSGGPGRPPRRRVSLVVPLLLLVAVVVPLTVMNGRLQENDAVATAFGTPRLANYAAGQGKPAGYTMVKTASYDWARRFYGSDSTWDRYKLETSQRSVPAYTSQPVYVDVIETGDRSALVAYGVEQCYKFHGYDIKQESSVDLGNGVVGKLLTWSVDDQSGSWNSVYWHWPVSTPEGTKYERVVILVNDDPAALYTVRNAGDPLDKGVSVKAGDLADATKRQEAARAYVAAFARQLVAKRTAATEKQGGLGA